MSPSCRCACFSRVQPYRTHVAAPRQYPHRSHARPMRLWRHQYQSFSGLVANERKMSQNDISCIALRAVDCCSQPAPHAIVEPNRRFIEIRHSKYKGAREKRICKNCKNWKKFNLDLPGFDPGTSPMLREHSELTTRTNWATDPRISGSLDSNSLQSLFK